MALCWPVTPSEVKFAVDSLLEGSGFELSVPLGHLPRRGLLDHRVELYIDTGFRSGYRGAARFGGR